MSKRNRSAPPALSYDEAVHAIAALVSPGARAAIIDALTDGGQAAAPDALASLRAAMRAHAFPVEAGTLSVRRVVESLDGRTRRDGLHVMHGWDYAAQRRPHDIAPVLLLDYCARLGIEELRATDMLRVLLEHYCLAVLGLLLVRAWDEGDANRHLDRIDGLLRDLQAPGASGHPVADGSGSLLMLAVAYFHPEEHAYGALLRKVWTLDEAHRLRLALPCAGIMASHLRWGWRFMYRQDLGAMRADNAVDYPWALFALMTLMREYTTLLPNGDAAARATMAAALLNGLACDPELFTNAPPAFLAEYSAEHAELRASLSRHREQLLADFARIEPSARRFSPVGFACNFVSNASVALATIACADGTRYAALDLLFRPEVEDNTAGSSRAEQMARRLMQYAAHPDRLGAGGAPLIVYDPYDGVHHYNAVVRALTRSG